MTQTDGEIHVLGLEEYPKQSTDSMFSSVAQSCPTLRDPVNRSTPGLPVHHQLPEFTQIQCNRYQITNGIFTELEQKHFFFLQFVWNMSDSLWPRGLYSPWKSSGQNTGVDSLSHFQKIFPTQGSKPRSPTLQADSLPAEPQGKPKNTGVGSLSLLQKLFPTQDLNWGLLHCRQILYQLSYEGSHGNTKDPK